MSNEIVPFSSTASHHSNPKRGCRDDGSRHLQDIPQFDKLNLSRPLDDLFTIIGDNHHMASLFPPINGHMYISQSNPTLSSVSHMLNKIKGPSILQLRGCDSFLQHHPFPFEKFITLSALEISSIDHLNTLPKEISEMSQLQSLNLSHLPIQHFPTDDFFSKLVNLRSLILIGCSRLVSLAKFPDRVKLIRLILKGCSKLQSLPSIKPLRRLQVLDVSHCTALQDLHLQHHSLSVLDLSYTVLHCTIEDQFTRSLSHVHCRDANGSVVDSLTNADRVQVLDLSGAQNLEKIFQFKNLSSFLTALDLSRTDIESIDFLSPAYLLCILTLSECRNLVKLPEGSNMQWLKVLDISSCESLCDLPEDLCELHDLEELNFSGCTSLRELKEDIFDQMTCLGKLDLSNTSFNHLPSFSNLNDLGTHLILSRNLVEIVPDLSKLINLNLEIVEVTSYGSDEIGNTIISNKPNELHIVSTFARMDSPFNEFKHKFTKVKDLILELQWSMEDTKLDFERILSDLEYILVKIDLFESVEEERGIKWKLMRDLMFAVENIKADDFIQDSTKLKKLFNLVVKLKLLVPHPLKKNSKMDIKNPELTWQHEEKKNAEGGIDRNTKQQIRSCYESLTEAQRNCLLYFAARVPNKYPMNGGEHKRITNSGIKERNLIQLWYGEGFIADPQQQKHNASELGLVEETGRQILKLLRRRGFIQRLSSRRWSMEDTIHRFLRGQVKEESFFDVDNDPTINWLTPQLIGCSQRACLLKSQSNLPSSCELWINYTKKVECFMNIRTLFNVNECIINIRPEWFSKMTNLTVLHLGRWDDKNEGSIEVVDMIFLKELKKMKKLRVLSFEGVAGISKLPDCICKLTDLRILNLKECSDLKELPSCIGTLTSLAHLNLTHCPLFTMLPMEIKLLSKLEVLKGFVMTYDDDGSQDKKACTLADLLKLDRLRKLSLVVNIDSFPNSEHLQIFKEMKNLCSLQITWLKNNYIYRRRQDPIGQKALKPSRWQQFKCWEPRTPQNDETNGQTMRSISALENLKKLVLCCFPSETAPKWLHPSELHNLEKLYIRGGHLKTLLPADTDQNISWNVKVLHLDHTLKLDIDWESLRQNFPNLKFLKKKPKGHLSSFPVDDISGLWQEQEEDEEDEEDDDDDEDEEEEDDDDEEEEDEEDEEDNEEDEEDREEDNEEAEEDDEADEEEAYVDLC